MDRIVYIFDGLWMSQGGIRWKCEVEQMIKAPFLMFEVESLKCGRIRYGGMDMM